MCGGKLNKGKLIRRKKAAEERKTSTRRRSCEDAKDETNME